MTLVDRVGQKFGNLVVISKAQSCASGAAWNCKCDCGGEIVVSAAHLKTGHTKSCGCLKHIAHHVTHGKSKSHRRTYRTWKEMRQRCLNPKSDKWQWYGGRGIAICERWESFENFFADMGERPEGKTIDRIDNDKGYSPDNCTWATQKEQVRKQSKNVFSMELAYKIRNENTGKRGYAASVARRYGVNRGTVSSLLTSQTWC